MANLVFYDTDHRYELDGVKVPSVTEICSHLAPPANVPPETMRMAAQRGSLVHELCELMDYDALPDEIPPEVSGYLEAYRKFCRDYRVEWIHIEHPVYSKQYGFAGTLDRYGFIQDDDVVVDLKTTANMDRAAKIKAACQTFGYSVCLSEAQGLGYATGLIVQLRKDGNYSAWFAEEIEKKYDTHIPSLFWESLDITREIGGYSWQTKSRYTATTPARLS